MEHTSTLQRPAPTRCGVCCESRQNQRRWREHISNCPAASVRTASPSTNPANLPSLKLRPGVSRFLITSVTKLPGYTHLVACGPLQYVSLVRMIGVCTSSRHKRDQSLRRIFEDG